jgi:hypothetical protein
VASFLGSSEPGRNQEGANRGNIIRLSEIACDRWFERPFADPESDPCPGQVVDPASRAAVTLSARLPSVHDAGAVAGAKPLIETMKKAKPFLFGQGSTSNSTPPPTQTPPALKHARDMTDAEFAETNKRKAWRGANAT